MTILWRVQTIFIEVDFLWTGAFPVTNLHPFPGKVTFPSGQTLFFSHRKLQMNEWYHIYDINNDWTMSRQRDTRQGDANISIHQHCFNIHIFQALLSQKNMSRQIFYGQIPFVLLTCDRKTRTHTLMPGVIQIPSSKFTDTALVSPRLQKTNAQNGN